MDEDLHPFTLAMPAAVTVDEEQRTISGIILPFDQIAQRTSAGQPVAFAPGSLVPPSDLSRIKLLIDHNQSAAVGYCIALDQSGTAATATFKIAPGAAGDDALAQATHRVRDGLSVGVDPRRRHRSADGSHLRVTQAVLSEVSLCALPAFTDARVTRVTATTTTTEENTTMDETVETTTAAPPAEIAAAAVPAETPAVQPAPFTATLTAAAPASSLDVFSHVAQLLSTGMSGAAITAALADVTTAADPALSLLPVGVIEKAWQAHAPERRWINNAVTNTKPLGTGRKLTAWGWKTRPTVGDYAGNKADIPSSAVEDQLFEGAVYRIAGGNDVDRIYIDMADGELIDELFAGYLDDYMVKSDAKVRDAILAAADATAIVTPPTNLPAALVALGLAMPRGARIDYVAVADDVWSEVAALTKDQVPWWLAASDTLDLGTSEGSIGRTKFWVDDSLPAGTVIGGDRRATTYREKQPPVKVQAVDIARGGVDLAVFGYAASFVSEPRAIIKMVLA